MLAATNIPSSDPWGQAEELCLQIGKFLNFRAALVARALKNPPIMWETWVRSLAWEDPLEKGTTTQSSILAWRFPRTEEPGGLPSIQLQRVGHDWSDIAHRVVSDYEPHSLNCPWGMEEAYCLCFQADRGWGMHMPGLGPKEWTIKPAMCGADNSSVKRRLLLRDWEI